MGLLTLPEAKTATGNADTVAYDAQLQQFVDAITPFIEDLTGPMVAATGVTRTYDGGKAALLLPSAVASITSVTENGVAVTDYTANLTAGILYGGTTTAPRCFKDGMQNVVVTYTVGSATIPANVKLAAIEGVRLWWQLGRQGNRPSFGDAEDADFIPAGVRQRIAELIAPNQRLAGLA